MTPETERPASGGDGRGRFQSVHCGGERRINIPKVWFRIAPDGKPLLATGRIAQTLLILIRADARGITSGEASVYRWARRTSDYVFRLRALGVSVDMRLERAGDARVGRYVLSSRIILLPNQEGDQCG